MARPETAWVCPKCKMPDSAPREVCRNCGVIVSKVRSEEARTESRSQRPKPIHEPVSEEESPSSVAGTTYGVIMTQSQKLLLAWVSAVVILIMMAVGVWYWMRVQSDFVRKQHNHTVTMREKRELTNIYAPIMQELGRVMKQLEVGLSVIDHGKMTTKFTRAVGAFQASHPDADPGLVWFLDRAACQLVLADTIWKGIILAKAEPDRTKAERDLRLHFARAAKQRSSPEAETVLAIYDAIKDKGYGEAIKIVESSRDEAWTSFQLLGRAAQELISAQIGRRRPDVERQPGQDGQTKPL